MIKKIFILVLLIIISTTFISYVLACGCGSQNTNSSSTQQTPQDQVAEEKVQCPVMKTWILPSEAADSAEYNGKTYYFCCGGCKAKFLAEPEKYISELSNNS